MTTSVVSRLGKAPEEGIKAPVVTASTGPLTLNGTGQTIDGVLTSTGQRVLVKDQALAAENGIYIVGANDWFRATDMNADNDVTNGQLVLDANRQILYQLTVVSPWTPGSTPINFAAYASSMPPSIVLTLSDPIDLVDTTVALITGANDPDTEPHLEYDFNTIQSKADATTVADLWLNRLGGVTRTGGNFDVTGDIIVSGNVDGRDVAADGTTQDTHIADGTIHFTQAAISITASQVSDFAAAVASTPPAAHTHVAADVTDFQTAVSANSDVIANTAKVSNVPTALALGTRTSTTMPIDSDGATADVVLPLFTSTLAGLVPGSGGGTANYMRADGTWAVPPGGAGLTVVVETTTSRTAAAGEAIMVDDDTAGSAVTIDLPAGSADDQIVVNKRGSTANVIIDGNGAETINGATTYTLTTQYESVWLIWTGTEWSIN